jgi:hypothetical protein
VNGVTPFAAASGALGSAPRSSVLEHAHTSAAAAISNENPNVHTLGFVQL